MTTAVIPNLPVFSFLDNNGHKASGYKVWTYLAGSSTLATTWQDQALTINNENPITLDSRGEAVIWLDSTKEYKFVLKTPAGATVRPYDDVSGGISGADFASTNDGLGISLVGNAIQRVANIATLRTIAVTTSRDIETQGYYTKGDGGHSAYCGVTGASAGTYIDNGGSIIVPTGGDGSSAWLLKVNGALSVKQWGAKVDGSTDDSAAITAFKNWLGSYGTMYFPEGTCLFNVDFGSARINIRGAGASDTYIRSFASGGYPITFSGNATWDLLEISDLTITGAGTRVDGGVQYGTDPYVSNQQYAGRVIYTRVKFTNLNIAIHKRYGNIGNQFHKCTFGECNYHWYGVAIASPLMHSGADGFFGCHFGGAQLASIYVDSPVTGSGGLYFDPECIFEANPGFVLFCKSMAGVWIPGITFDSCWNESNATASSVTIDGVSYAPRDFYLNTARQVSVRNMRLTKVELLSATLSVDHCNLDGLTLVADSASAILSTNQLSDNFRNLAVYSPTVRSGIRGAGTNATVFSSKPRALLTRDRTALQHQTFAEGPVTFTGSASRAANQVADGQLFDSCVEFTINAGETEYPSGTVTFSASKYIVSTIDIKLVSGSADATFSVQNLSPQTNVDNSHWRTLVTLTHSNGVTPAAIRPRLIGPASGSSVIRLSAYQTIEFDTLQEALAFVDKLLYVAPSTLPRTVYGTAAPTTGTWNVGDICINRTPSVGAAKAWRCTVAGTPGTWVSEGNL